MLFYKLALFLVFPGKLMPEKKNPAFGGKNRGEGQKKEGIFERKG